MSESAAVQPSNRVLPHELPASLRDAGLANWIREPLDDAVDRRRRIIMPPAAATMGTPASGYQRALLAEARHPDTIFMMGGNPALPAMPERPTLRDFFQLRFSAVARTHLLQSARRPGVRRLSGGAHVAHDDLAQQLPVTEGSRPGRPPVTGPPSVTLLTRQPS